MSELDDDAFERAYQRMIFRRNQETLRRETEGGWHVNHIVQREDVDRFVDIAPPAAFIEHGVRDD